MKNEIILIDKATPLSNNQPYNFKSLFKLTLFYTNIPSIFMLSVSNEIVISKSRPSQS